ncbi:hypothetical protein BOTBODRAFT_142993 [Botryobasidium botryosum FD-172 SS1]|uniref:Uncharacterized protein n=1 Tax=Botryobasidium botryosum (strain FD-172 SS1) TaxID=930990 RepID=A0A067N5Q9_BOTB1|nr:hypothetical protein BOTBODRAFT_142993 [Botryobasidium botryosum FD-172 SS1]
MNLPISTLVTSLFQTLLDRIQLDYVNGDPPAHKLKSFSVDLELAAEARAALDQEIKMIQLTINAFKNHTDRLLSATRHRRNQHAPIHCLPPELISSIFELAVPGALGHTSGDEVPLNVVRVSRDWRQIAMDSPRAWAHIPMVPEPLLSTFLERSKNVPLELTFYRTTREATLHHMARISPSHLERTRALKLDLVGMEKQIHKVESWLSTPLPALETLEIRRPVPRGGMDLTADTPRLQHLSLKGSLMPFDHPIYSNLATLTLSHIVFIETPSTVGLLRALEASPSFEELNLQYMELTVTVDREPELSTGMPVNLPHLRLLSIKDVPAPITRFFLNHIITPASSRIVMEADGGDIASIFPSRPENLRNIVTTTELSVTAKDDGTTLEVEGHSSESGGSFSLKFTRRSGLAHAMFKNLAKVVAMPHLRTLSARHFSGNKKGPSSFARALGNFPSITTLKFEVCHATLADSIMASRAKNQHVCPLLQHLFLFGCSIKEEALLMLVRSRSFNSDDGPSATSRPLERLDLDCCRELTEEVVPKLLEYLKVVHWGARRFEQEKIEATGADVSRSA